MAEGKYVRIGQGRVWHRVPAVSVDRGTTTCGRRYRFEPVGEAQVRRTIVFGYMDGRCHKCEKAVA